MRRLMELKLTLNARAIVSAVLMAQCSRPCPYRLLKLSQATGATLLSLPGMTRWATRRNKILHLDFALKLRQYFNELGCCMDGSLQAFKTLSGIVWVIMGKLVANLA